MQLAIDQLQVDAHERHSQLIRPAHRRVHALQTLQRRALEAIENNLIRMVDIVLPAWRSLADAHSLESALDQSVDGGRATADQLLDTPVVLGLLLLEALGRVADGWIARDEDVRAGLAPAGHNGLNLFDVGLGELEVGEDVGADHRMGLLNVTWIKIKFRKIV